MVEISSLWSRLCKFRLSFEPRTDTGGEVQIDNYLEFGGYSRFQVIIQAE
jgi:hypothetical protein